MTGGPGPTVHLLRHGQSTWNAERRFQGQADAPLTDLGRAQAKETGAALSRLLAGHEPHVVCSDLMRAAQTAEAVAEALAVPVAAHDRGLREISAGPWQGLLPPEIAAGWPAEYARYMAGEDVPAGGDETPSAAGRRVVDAVSRHQREAEAQGRVLVAVGHGASIRGAMMLTLSWPAAIRRLGNLGNCHRAEIVVGPDAEWRLSRWNVPPT